MNLTVDRMSFSALFIRRPVATVLLALGVVWVGLLAFYRLPVAALPKIDFPIIVVSANLSGASPETMSATIATPLERALGRIAGLNEMTSQSTRGSTRIILQFDFSRNVDAAARDVQAAINAARVDLPAALRNNPSYFKVNPSAAPMIILALTSKTLTPSQIYDAASTILMQRLSQVDGVGQVSLGGGALPAVRVELNPLALNHKGISLEAVRSALVNSNANRPKGEISNAQERWQIGANDQANDADSYQSLIIAWKNSAPVILSDIATVKNSVEDLRNAGISNGESAVIVTLRSSPNANIIETVDQIKALLPQLKAGMPAAIQMDVAMDRTLTIRASIDEVEATLALSILLITLVVYAFLRDIRAAIIACISLPITIFGNFALMYLWGYSLNNFTLMAITIGTGFVIDDAIVVVENSMRHIEAGMPPKAAAFRSAHEVIFTLISMSTGLVAVFIPMLFMGGLVGRLFGEFSMTLTFSIIISLIVSLTLTPMLAAHLTPRSKPTRWQTILGRGFDTLHHLYEKSLAFTLRYIKKTLLVLLAIILANIGLFISVSKDFFPSQDTGRLIGFIETDQSTSFESIKPKLQTLSKIIQADPAVESVTGFTSGNGGRLFVALKPLNVRKISADYVVNRLRPKLKNIAGATVYLSAAQEIRSGGRSSNANYQYTLEGSNFQELEMWAPKLLQALHELPQFTDISSDQKSRALELMLDINRNAAARLGVTERAIDANLYDAFGQRQISRIYSNHNQYSVVMEVAPNFRQYPDILKKLYVPNQDGRLIPLLSFANYVPRHTTLAVNHQGQFAAITLSFNLVTGVSLSEAIQAIDIASAAIRMPGTIHGSFEGTSKIFQQSFDTLPWLLVAGLLTLYIILGILYENLIHPLTILSTLPSAGVGALLILMACHMSLSIMAFIGIVLLIGIVMKNAIMMIDFALVAQRKQNLNSHDAIAAAASHRLRPILMTTCAAILGALPMALAHGIGSELRIPLGLTIIGGLIFSQALTLYTTPVVFLALDVLQTRCKTELKARIKRIPFLRSSS